jgi:thiol-disulfide isomerase/thioredoxin
MSSLLSLFNLAEIQNLCAAKEMILVLYSSPGCIPCKVLHPIIEKVALKYPDNIGFVYVESNEYNNVNF